MRIARLVPLVTLLVQISLAQWASVRETTMVFPTYGFSDPNPLPRFSNIYPYYRFEGYSLSSVDQSWKVVVLENPYVRVLIAPDMGGKILGAFEKKTGKDFIYFNKVVKFREIAMRGPWTSGGIEFNFGAIGHAPTTATPVDYAIDASGPDAVCIVGAWDLASRTYWTVEIVLPPDAAYVETRSRWTNRTELNTSLYHWMNAAADARNDLVFEYPGTAYIGHDGSVFPYPVSSDGNEINFYRNNARGSNKSFHVLGTYTDFFGARYEESRTGVIHWAPYTDKPGKKIWQWSQARDGAIWTDLLTDPERGNPQYVEIQNGLLFNQAAANSTQTPYKHRFLTPHAVRSFSEAWFPFNGIGPIVDANTHGVLSVTRGASGGENGNTDLTVGLSAVSPITNDVVLMLDGKEAARKRVSLSPLESMEFSLDVDDAHSVEVSVGDKMLSYSAEDAAARKLSRPKLPNIEFDWESAHGHATIAVEHARQRRFAEAQLAFEQSLGIDPSFTPALVGLAEMSYRQMEYDKAIGYASQALANDTYDPAANFIYGVASRRIGRLYDAMDALGIASTQESHKAAASIELAEIAFIRGRAGEFQRSLARVDMLGPQYSTIARDLRMLSGSAPEEAVTAKPEGPLDHMYFANRYVLDPNQRNADALKRSIRTELPHESYLEIALQYASLHAYEYALRILELSPTTPYVDYWRAHLFHLTGEAAQSSALLKSANTGPIDLVFPHRAEDLGMFLWAEKNLPHWKTKYYISLVLLNVGRNTEAISTLRNCGTEPDAPAFYLLRGSLMAPIDPAQAENDYLKAYQLDVSQWRAPRTLAQFFTRSGRYQEALEVLMEARIAFPKNYILQFDHAQSLLYNGQAREAVVALETTTLLPFEGARVGREVWNRACIFAALDAINEKKWTDAISLIEKARLWPERLGVGRPDVVDERIEDFLESRCRGALQDETKADMLLRRVAERSLSGSASDLLTAIALRETGRQDDARQSVTHGAGASATEAWYWGRAVFEGTDDVRMAFEKEFMQRRKAGTWEIIPEDPSFVLVYAISAAL